MLYFQLVIMAGTVMLAYYFEYTDTFAVHVQGFFCYDTTYTKPYLGPEDSSAVPPLLLYAAVAGLPTLLVSGATAVLQDNFLPLLSPPLTAELDVTAEAAGNLLHLRGGGGG
ncbi:Lipid phosphate phosphatase-related protein type 5 [Oryzias melastigma]|uniref:Lipid phosphate phosphatase-related protein type 5 n=1 Tax=Oryzias melastigma TaxID=30732 RepID=A0A834F8L1_ORYME|nr:Lipid phosphate phosphatase-related protein type 5 [Oryzias melastigma]